MLNFVFMWRNNESFAVWGVLNYFNGYNVVIILNSTAYWQWKKVFHGTDMSLSGKNIEVIYCVQPKSEQIGKLTVH
jgi:hypothetical protein